MPSAQSKRKKAGHREGCQAPQKEQRGSGLWPASLPLREKDGPDYTDDRARWRSPHDLKVFYRTRALVGMNRSTLLDTSQKKAASELAPGALLAAPTLSHLKSPKTDASCVGHPMFVTKHRCSLLRRCPSRRHPRRLGSHKLSEKSHLCFVPSSVDAPSSSWFSCV